MRFARVARCWMLLLLHNPLARPRRAAFEDGGFIGYYQKEALVSVYETDGFYSLSYMPVRRLAAHLI